MLNSIKGHLFVYLYYDYKNISKLECFIGIINFYRNVFVLKVKLLSKVHIFISFYRKIRKIVFYLLNIFLYNSQIYIDVNLFITLNK